MVLAELNAFASRPIAPTRRIALGDSNLPCSPAPGKGGLLLGAIVARFASSLDEDSQVDLVALINQVERFERVAQPRLRHRFQKDHVGLQRISYRMESAGDAVSFHFETDKATPTQHILTAVYAAQSVERDALAGVTRVLRRAMVFPGGSDAELMRFLVGHTRGGLTAFSDPVMWALEVLKLSALTHKDHRTDSIGRSARRRSEVALTPQELAHQEPPTAQQHELLAAVPRLPTRAEIQRAFRLQLRHSHPDHGAERVGAAERIADLAEARRILLEC